jgi:hypothetical protein
LLDSALSITPESFPLFAHLEEAMMVARLAWEGADISAIREGWEEAALWIFKLRSDKYMIHYCLTEDFAHEYAQEWELICVYRFRGGNFDACRVRY